MKGAKLGEEGEKKVKEALEGLTRDLVAMEQRLNELDSGSGDGDCGSTLAAGAKAIQAALPSLWRTPSPCSASWPASPRTWAAPPAASTPSSSPLPAGPSRIRWEDRWILLPGCEVCDLVWRLS